MDLIIGGAYQGKTDFAKQKYSLEDEEIFNCTESGEISFCSKCINRISEFTLWCARNDIDAVNVFKEHRSEWKNSVLICDDIFCGVVPLGADMRAWRELTGRLCGYLSAEADAVFRLFCGLEQRIK